MGRKKYSAKLIEYLDEFKKWNEAVEKYDKIEVAGLVSVTKECVKEIENPMWEDIEKARLNQLAKYYRSFVNELRKYINNDDSARRIYTFLEKVTNEEAHKMNMRLKEIYALYCMECEFADFDFEIIRDKIFDVHATHAGELLHRIQKLKANLGRQYNLPKNWENILQGYVGEDEELKQGISFLKKKLVSQYAPWLKQKRKFAPEMNENDNLGNYKYYEILSRTLKLETVNYIESGIENIIILINRNADKNEIRQVIYKLYMETVKFHNYQNTLDTYLRESIKENKNYADVIFRPNIYIEKENTADIEELTERPYTFEDLKPKKENKIVYGERHNSEIHKGYIEKNYFQSDIIREGIGLDRCKFRIMKINYIDEVTLVSSKKHLEVRSIVDDAWMVANTTTGIEPIFEKIKGYGPLLKEKNWTSIKIQLSPHAIFTAKKNNVKRKNSEEESKDLYFLEMTVIPKNEVLGNFENSTIEERKKDVKDAIDKLREEFGIYIGFSDIALHTVELNNTFAFEYNLNDLTRFLKYYQYYLPDYFNHGTYEVGKNGNKLNVASKMKVTQKERETRNRKGMTVTGLGSKSDNIKIIIYDKSMETCCKYSNSNKNGKLDIVAPFVDGNGTFIRVEFTMSGTHALHTHFRCIYDKNSSDYKKEHEYMLKDISDEHIHKVYVSLVAKYLIDSFKEHCRDSEMTLQRIVNQIDTSKRDWQHKFLRDIYEEEIISRKTPMLIQPIDIDNAIKYSPQFCQRKARYTKMLHRILEGSDEYQTNRINGYDILSKFLLAAKEERGISCEREIRYKRS